FSLWTRGKVFPCTPHNLSVSRTVTTTKFNNQMEIFIAGATKEYHDYKQLYIRINKNINRQLCWHNILSVFSSCFICFNNLLIDEHVAERIKKRRRNFHNQAIRKLCTNCGQVMDAHLSDYVGYEYNKDDYLKQRTAELEKNPNKNAESAFFPVSEKNDLDLKRKILSKSIVEKMSDNTRTNQERDEVIAGLTEEVGALKAELKYCRNKSDNLEKIVSGEAPPIPLKRHNFRVKKEPNSEKTVSGEAPPLPPKKPDEEARKTVKEVVEHYENISNGDKATVNRLKTALKGSTKSFWIGIVNNDPQWQMIGTREVMEDLILQQLLELGGLKFSEVLKVKMVKGMASDSNKEEGVFFFNSYTSTITEDRAVPESVRKNTEVIVARISNFQERGSNWREKDPQRIKKSDRKLVKSLDYSGVTFPVGTKDILKIERQNRIRVSVFGYSDSRQFFTIHVSTEKFDDHMELLMISNETTNHYVLIKDFNRMMFSVSKNRCKKHFCMYCLQSFTTEDILNKHTEICMDVNGKQTVTMPGINSFIKFKNFHRQLPVPFTIYADFEAILEKVNGESPDELESYTHKYHNHTCCGYGYKVVCHFDDSYSKPYKHHRGKDSINHFIKSMLEESRLCREVIKGVFNVEMKLSKEDLINFEKADKCSICGVEYKDEDIKVRDHCHATGKYRGSAHKACNLNFRMVEKVPVVFHNLRGYDSHLIMQEIATLRELENQLVELGVNSSVQNGVFRRIDWGIRRMSWKLVVESLGKDMFTTILDDTIPAHFAKLKK
ncbi:Hypothetical predicted protein, partial [Paramuricea clavata]